MKTKVNKIFALIVQPHWGWYLLVFFIFWTVVFFYYPIPKSYKTDFKYSGVSWYVIWPSIFLVSWCKNLFYSKADRQFLDKRVRVGIPATDTFFYAKINSDISKTKKFCGYVYALLKPIAFGGIGYIMAIASVTLFKS